jgi:ketosteroid isomerase-like protein
MTEATLAVISQFGDAFSKHDPSLLDGIIADDCVLENTNPAPDGSRHEGGAACLEWWKAIAANQDMNFETEETWASGDRAIRRWRLRWGPGESDTVRGVNIMRVRDGQIVEAFGYVKG